MVTASEDMKAMEMDNATATGELPDGTPTFDELVERCIDFMESLGLPLEPWQANAFRAIMLWQNKNPEGRIAVAPQRQWGGTTAPSNPPWGGGSVENVSGGPPLPPHIEAALRLPYIDAHRNDDE
jgi:hypothetical protein